MSMARESRKKKEERIGLILEALDREYGTDFRCYLDHENAYQLLFSTIMSAQCTDARVNMVTKTLYKKYPTLEAFVLLRLHR